MIRTCWKKLSYAEKGLLIIALAFTFNILETWFFGWHLHAQSTAEGFCDEISAIGMCIGMFLIAAHATGTMITEWLEKELSDYDQR